MGRGIGTFVRELRQHRRWTIEELARRAGLSRATLSNWERGLFQPRLRELTAALDALGATPRQRERALTLVQAPRAIARLREEAEEQLPAHVGEAGFAPTCGDLLRALRARRRLGREQVAARLGVHPRTILRWEQAATAVPEERFEELCSLLGARPEERSVLRCRRLLIAPALFQRLSLDRVEAELDVLADQVERYDCPLGDLRLLMVEAQVWSEAARSEPARRMLARAFGIHAAYLHWQGRFSEANHYGNRALDMLDMAGPPQWFWFKAAVASDVRPVERAARRDLPGVVAHLHHWLDLAVRPEFQALILTEIAVYLAMAGEPGQRCSTWKGRG